MTQSFPFKSAPFTILERSNRRDLAKKVKGVYFVNEHKDCPTNIGYNLRKIKCFQNSNLE